MKWKLVLAFVVSGRLLDAQLIQRDIEYATVENTSLKLDLYLPSETTAPSALVIWIHGGAWRAGSKNNVPIAGLVEHGFAIASVDYRLSPVAKFPAQVHDIKAAIRYLRASADKYGFDCDKFYIAGASAGGHLAALTGVSNGHAELEGSLGKNRKTSSDVQKVVSFYGASNLSTILAQSTPHGLSVREPALDLLLGKKSPARKKLAQLASPVRHIDGSDPPLLLIHGDQDPQMPINQAHELHGKYKQHGRPVHFEVIHGGAHGGPVFYNSQRIRRLAGFLRNGQWE